MKKITLMKNYRQTETLRLVELENVVELLRGSEYEKAVGELRRYYPMLNLERKQDGGVAGADRLTDKLPRLCFASALENKNRQRVNRGYTGLVLLEVNNLTGYDEADAIRRGAGDIPQTLIAYVGASGRSVKIVCRGELFPSDREDGEPLPAREQEIMLFHENLYERARMAYNTQLGVTVEKLEPGLQRTCYVSKDDDIVYNPLAIPFYARSEKPKHNILLVRQSTMEPEEEAPGQSRYLTLHHIYEYNLERAYDECQGIPAGEERSHLLLIRTAVHCCKTGIPMAVAKRLTRFHSGLFGTEDGMLVNKVFGNVYRSKQMQRYQEQKNIRMERNVPPETLLTMKIDIFLNENYEIRKNVMRGVAEFRERTGIGFSFRDLTEEARNSITMRALTMGIKCWDKDIRRYIMSEDIEQYDPLNEYLESLPRWDGKDRVKALANRVPTDSAEWPRLFHLWLRSMVAMWLGKGQLTGNSLVPLLIGRQGCGKSSFCRILLPSHLRDYYNDRINFKNENDLNLGLTSFGLINLDEFDKITQQQQIVLKYLVSTADLKYRSPYGKTYAQHRRFASFIGTTNKQDPLTDPSGSRRFICVQVDGDIDFRTPINYSQLYAQLYHEIRQGERYWPTREEEQALIIRNQRFQQLNALGEMLMTIIQRPDNDEDGQWLSLKSLSSLLRSHFKNYREDIGTFRKIGTFLNRPEYRFKSKHLSTGVVYWVKLKE
ncbi:MAG: hypothetical protein K2J86_08495 [Prevotella sp.]|nr:hypothetical protein [Prevotella sp.]